MGFNGGDTADSCFPADRRLLRPDRATAEYQTLRTDMEGHRPHPEGRRSSIAQWGCVSASARKGWRQNDAEKSENVTLMLSSGRA